MLSSSARIIEENPTLKEIKKIVDKHQNGGISEYNAISQIRKIFEEL